MFFCRFIPGVRSLISIPAGVAGMSMLPFLLLSGLGMGIWAGVLALLGMTLGENYEKVAQYLNPVGTTVVIGLLIFWMVRIIRNIGS